MKPTLNLDYLSPQWYVFLNDSLFGKYYTQDGAMAAIRKANEDTLIHEEGLHCDWAIVHRHYLPAGLSC